MRSVLVTGGGGFVGSELVRQLIDSGYDVRVAGRNRYKHVEQLGAHCVVGDIADSAFADQACEGVETVYHTAAKAGIWGRWQDYRRTNIDGTINIVNSCRKQKVSSLVYTSTPSVVFDQQDIVNGDETLPYAETFLCHYARSKTIAERYVLDSNDTELRTCAIRPHLIWGPGDPHLIPRLIDRGKQGKLKIVGDGSNLVDITYVDNVAHAHCLAAENLHNSGSAAGQSYFVGQEQPVKLWDWVNDLYRDLDICPITRAVPFSTAYRVGGLMESLFRILPGSPEPPMTRFLALQLARSHYFSHRKAEKDFGYRPLVSLAEGKERLLASLNR